MFVELGDMLEAEPVKRRVKKLQLEQVDDKKTPSDLFLEAFGHESGKFKQLGSVRFDLIDVSRGEGERVLAGVVTLPNKDNWPRAYSVAIWGEERGDSLSVFFATFVDDHERVPFFRRNVSGFAKRIEQLKRRKETRSEAREMVTQAKMEAKPLQSLAKDLYDDICDRLGYEADMSSARAQG